MNFHEACAAVREGVIGAAAVRVRPAAVMAALLQNAAEIVAAVFVQVHVEIHVARPLFAEHDGVADVQDGVLIHAVAAVHAQVRVPVDALVHAASAAPAAPALAHWGGGAQILEIIVPAVEQITARMIVGQINRTAAAAGGRVRDGLAQAEQQLQVFAVSIIELVRPAGGRQLVRVSPARRIMALVVVHIHVRGQAQLPDVVETPDAFGRFLRPAQGGQQHRRQNPDDGDDHEQFDQGEGGDFMAA